jgi:predicted metal-binding protein
MRIIRVKTCAECPYRRLRTSAEEKYHCEKRLQNSNITHCVLNNLQPDWCPLENIQGITRNLGVPNGNY